MPKAGDQNVLARGMRTWPPSASAVKMFFAAASFGA